MTVAPSETMDRKSPEPLWSQLQRDLLRRLEAGEFEGWFPGEMFLVGEYKVSRNTVRDALRRLREDGVVVAERGGGPGWRPRPKSNNQLAPSTASLPR